MPKFVEGFAERLKVPAGTRDVQVFDDDLRALPHGVTSITGGVINTFSYDAKGNMTSGNGLTVGYTSYNKPATITRGTNSVSFDHDPSTSASARSGSEAPRSISPAGR